MCIRIKFEVNLYLSNPTWTKCRDKTLKTLRTKNLLRRNKKHFSLLLKGFQTSKWQFFLEGESPTLIQNKKRYPTQAATRAVQ